MIRCGKHRFVFAVAFVFAACGGVAAQDTPLLRYGCAAGKQYAYEVKIQIEADKYDEIYEGVLKYTVASAKEDEFVLKPSANCPACQASCERAYNPADVAAHGAARFQGDWRTGRHDF